MLWRAHLTIYIEAQLFYPGKGMYDIILGFEYYPPQKDLNQRQKPPHANHFIDTCHAP